MMIKHFTRTAALAAGIGLAGSSCLQAQDPSTLEAQWAAYEAVAPKTVLDLQPFRQSQDAEDGQSGLLIKLVSLNPATGAWFLLQTLDAADGTPRTYHIEVADPAVRTLSLSTGAQPALIIGGDNQPIACRPWAGEIPTELDAARKSGLPYAPLCGGQLYLRNRVRGSRTNVEAAAEFLRDNVWGGESIVRFVRDSFFRDRQLESSREVDGNGDTTAGAGPAPMLVEGEPATISTLLDLGLDTSEPGRMTIGLWYPVAGINGVFASAFQPRAISRSVMDGPGTVNRLDGVEAKATGYMIAFDLGFYDIGFAMGTDHPSLGWSSRPPASVRPRGMPGPDGISKPDPLVLLGMVNPSIADRAVATFTAGFKRQHGAFKFGDMASFNYGHHYGFIEKGVILSKLQPNLSTIFGLTDGTIAMKTWTEADNALLPRITFARQNGVPLVETDPATGKAVPGERVTKWGPGNWSGSAKAELRTLRAGGCTAQSGGRTYLIYGYFSSATPSAMARTFQAYGCSYAMQLDMNALEHTYLALYVPIDGKVHVQHLMPGMALIDKKAGGGIVLPRFIGFADNRDLFYVTRKEPRK